MGIRITGIGAYVPSKTVTNQELSRQVDTSDNWIDDQDRHPRAADLGTRRGAQRHGLPGRPLRCLEHAGVDKSAVDLIVVACATPDQSQPAVACMIQEKLGVAPSQCPAFDVNSVCAGFVFALDAAQGMMLSAPERVPQRAGHRHRRVLEDPELEGPAHLHLLR